MKAIFQNSSWHSPYASSDSHNLTLIAYFIRLLREDDKLEKKPSVRASIGLYERSQSNALLKGRKNVQFEDIKEVLVSVLSHRIRLKPSVRYLEDIETYIQEKFHKNIEGTKWQNLTFT